MLATGNSERGGALDVKNGGSPFGDPRLSRLGPEGIEHYHAEHPDVHIVTAAVDRGLDERGFIVPPGRRRRPAVRDSLAL